jgi:hypothetical protein
MSSPFRQHNEKGQLCAAVPFPERMDRVQLGNNGGSLVGKLPWIKMAQFVLGSQAVKQRRKLSLDVFRIAESAFAFRNADAANLAGPVVDILKQMMMDREIIEAGVSAPAGSGSVARSDDISASKASRVG